MRSAFPHLTTLACLIIGLLGAFGCYRSNAPDLSGADSGEWFLSYRGDTVPLGKMPESQGLETPAINFRVDARGKEIPCQRPLQVYDSLWITQVAIQADSLVRMRPGHAGIAFPDTFYTKGKLLKIRESEWIKSSPLRAKEANLADIEYLDVDQGLGAANVNAMLMDSRGIMWVGTTQGLTLYSGQFVKHYTKASGLPDEDITRLFEDRQHRIWIGTKYGGAIRYDGFHFTHFSNTDGLSNNYVNAFAEDLQGKVWIGMWGGGIARFDGEKLVSYGLKSGFLDTRVTGLAAGRDSFVWISINGKGLMRFDGQDFAYYSHEKYGTVDQYVNCLSYDPQDNLWLGTWREFKYLKNDTLYSLHYKGYDSDNIVVDLLHPSPGIHWFAIFGKGLMRYDGTSLRLFSEQDGLSNNQVSGICADPAGNIWASTAGSGICRLRENSFHVFSEKNGLKSKTVYALRRSKDGRILAGTLRGLHVIDALNVRQYAFDPAGNDLEIKDLLEDKQGRLWMATMAQGLLMISGDTLFGFAEGGRVGNHNITAITERANGELWFGTLGTGLTVLKNNRFIQYRPNASPRLRVVSCLFTDRQDRVWAGSEGEGLMLYDDTCFYRYAERNGLADNYVTGITQDQFGNILIATRNGISKWMAADLERDKSKPVFYNLRSTEGLLSASVSGIQEDRSGNLWIPTIKGLQVLRRTSSENKPGWDLSGFESYTYEENDGIPSKNFLDHSILLDGEDQLWLGTAKGLVMTDLKNGSQKRQVPSVHLNTLKINGVFIDFNRLQDSLQQQEIPWIGEMETGKNGSQAFQNLPDALRLPYHLNHLSFFFSGVEWQAPLKQRYSYKLEGYDQDWSALKQEYWADYRNLAPGTYTFKVRALGAAQTWSETSAYTFTIRPPWWQTWTARTVFLLLGIGMVYRIVHWRTRYLLQQQERLEKVVSDRTAEVVQEKREVEIQRDEVEKQRRVSDGLLLNILPEETARELKEKGASEARLHEEVTVMFCDIQGFTEISEQLGPQELVAEINECFTAFDRIVQQYGVEKIKTIGDAYLAAGGLPLPSSTHAVDIVQVSLDIQAFMESLKQQKLSEGKTPFQLRIGVHTGPVVAGIVGLKKFQYDIWGDTVNTSNRLQSSGAAGRVNISESTYELVKHRFKCIPRGKILAKGKGEIEMFFVEKM